MGAPQLPNAGCLFGGCARQKRRRWCDYCQNRRLDALYCRLDVQPQGPTAISEEAKVDESQHMSPPPVCGCVPDADGGVLIMCDRHRMETDLRSARQVAAPPARAVDGRNFFMQMPDVFAAAQREARPAWTCVRC